MGPTERAHRVRCTQIRWIVGVVGGTKHEATSAAFVLSEDIVSAVSCNDQTARSDAAMELHDIPSLARRAGSSAVASHPSGSESTAWAYTHVSLIPPSMPFRVSLRAARVRVLVPCKEHWLGSNELSIAVGIKGCLSHAL